MSPGRRAVRPGAGTGEPGVEAQGSERPQQAGQDVGRIVRAEGHPGDPDEHDLD